MFLRIRVNPLHNCRDDTLVQDDTTDGSMLNNPALETGDLGALRESTESNSKGKSRLPRLAKRARHDSQEPSMDYKALKWSVHDNPNNPGEPCIGVLTLNRPEKLNAVDPLMRLELDALCNEIARNSIVKVVILTGRRAGLLRRRRSHIGRRSARRLRRFPGHHRPL